MLTLTVSVIEETALEWLARRGYTIAQAGN